VALLADGIHIGAIQKLRIRSPMREVAGCATFGFDSTMFINEGSGRRGVAFGAHHELSRRRPHRILSQGVVRIVAVCAFHQTLFYLVVEGQGKLRLDIAVALEAELRICHFEQMPRHAGGMDAVAADAAYIALPVRRAVKVCVLPCMAAQAFVIHLFGGGLGGVEDPGNVVATDRVRFAGSVTAFASQTFAAMHQRQPAVRIIGKVLRDIFVAGRAGACAHEVVVSGAYGRVNAWFGSTGLSGH
jgi:hypothetical protein